MHFTAYRSLLLLLMACTVCDCEDFCVDLDILSSKTVADSEVNLTFALQPTGNCSNHMHPPKVVRFVHISSMLEFCQFAYVSMTKLWVNVIGHKESCVCPKTENYRCSVKGTLGEGWNVIVTMNNGFEESHSILASKPRVKNLTICDENSATTTTPTTTTMQQNHLFTPLPAIIAAAATASDDDTAADTTADADSTVVDVDSTVTISCSWSEGLPARDAQLTLNGLDLNATEEPASSHRGDRRLRHKYYVITHVRCADSRRVECRVPWAEVNMTRTLVVRCPPSGRYDVGTVTIVNEPVSFTFDVTANPPPERLTFFYLGTSITDTPPMEISDSQIQLTGVCQPKAGVLYQSTCTVTVTNVTMDTVSSFYQVTITNSQGSGHFRFHVLCKGCGGSSGAESDALSYFGLAVGVCVVLAVIIIIIILVVIQMWRWRWTLPCADTSNPTGRNNPTSSNSPARHPGPSNPTSGSDAIFIRNTMGSNIRSTSSAYDYPQPVPQHAEQTGPYAIANLDDVGQRAVYTRLRSHDTPHAAGLRLPAMRSSDPSDYLHPIAGLVERADTAQATGLRLQSVTSRESETYLHPIPGPAD